MKNKRDREHTHTHTRSSVQWIAVWDLSCKSRFLCDDEIIIACKIRTISFRRIRCCYIFACCSLEFGTRQSQKHSTCVPTEIQRYLYIWIHMRLFGIAILVYSFFFLLILLLFLFQFLLPIQLQSMLNYRVIIWLIIISKR